MKPELIAMLQQKDNARQELLLNIVNAGRLAEKPKRVTKAVLADFLIQYRDALIEFFKADEELDIARCPKEIKPAVERIAKGERAKPERRRPHLRLVKG